MKVVSRKADEYKAAERHGAAISRYTQMCY